MKGCETMSVIAYFDESGDDGLKNFASETFILTSLYMHTSNWDDNFQRIKDLDIM